MYAVLRYMVHVLQLMYNTSTLLEVGEPGYEESLLFIYWSTCTRVHCMSYLVPGAIALRVQNV
jgi:hypothetical protein